MDIRRTELVASVRFFAAHLLGIKALLPQLIALMLTPKTATDVKSAIRFVSSFVCIEISAIWLKILYAVDQRKQAIQGRKATTDVKVANLVSLVSNLKELHKKLPQIGQETFSLPLH